ncbi:MAG: hypothetical protein SV186_02390, partial [Candidatus Nanohaloarchaea archaeon]|nr:hypothetical protein [Candidatus Nanohaloarchaea archaeon]
MTDDLNDLAELAENAVGDAREHYDELDDALALRSHDLKGGEDTVDSKTFDGFTDDLFDELDDLYGVETDEGLRDYIDSRISYDWSTGERVKRTGRNALLAGSMLAAGERAFDPDGSMLQAAVETAQHEPLLGLAGVTAAAGGIAAVDTATRRVGSGTYVTVPYPGFEHEHRDINISPDDEPADYTYPVTVAEVTHAYQDLWNSPSFDDPIYEEGLDVGAQLAVADRMQDQDLFSPEDSSWRRCHTLVFAYGELATDGDGIDPTTLEDIGLDEDEAEQAVERYQEHSGLRDRRSALIGGAALYTTAQKNGYDVYED